MTSKMCSSCNLLAWGSLVMVVLLLHLTAAYESNDADELQSRIEKRIFCNFDGCHNKRSGDSLAWRRVVDRLLADKAGLEGAGLEGAGLEGGPGLGPATNLLAAGHRAAFSPADWEADSTVHQSDDVTGVARHGALWRVLKQRFGGLGYNVRRRRSVNM